MPEEITILIADDHPVFQRGLREIIESDADLRIVAAVGDGETALAEIRRVQPNVAVLDVDMPKRDGLAVIEAIRDEGLACGVVLLTMYKEERFLNAALDAGVCGYVVKDSAIEEIKKAIRAAARDDSFVSPTLADILYKRLQKHAAAKASPLNSLTASERRVLKLVADSRSSRQIADELFISVRTVENHRANICAKLGLEGKNALLAYAITNRSTF